MLEILLLRKIARHIGEIARGKGRTAWPFYLLLVVLWFGGEITGGIIGALLGEMFGWSGLLIYLIALAGAAASAALSFFIVSRLKSLNESFPAPPPPPTFG